MVNKRFERKPKACLTDNGGESNPQKIKNCSKEQGMLQEKTVTYTY